MMADASPRFTRYIGIDYSGARRPADPLPGIQVYLAGEGAEPARAPSPDDPDGQWSRAALAEWLMQALSGGEPAVVGIDFSFSFPLSYYRRHGLNSWDAFLEDFAGHIPTRKRPVKDLLPEPPRWGPRDALRYAERLTRTAKSVFNFVGSGNVAFSTYAGLPWLLAIRRALGDHAHWWPYDGWQPPAGISVITEAYPALYRPRIPHPAGLTEHERDAYLIAAWLQNRDRHGLLTRYFTPPLTPEEAHIAELEGWIIGVM